MIEQGRSQKRSITYRWGQDLNFYKIICKNCNLALRSEIRQKKQQDDQIRIMGAIQDPISLKQLWMLKSMRDKKQLVNFWTDLVIDSENGNVKLERGKQKNTQKFQIEYIYSQKSVKSGKNKKLMARIKDSNNLYLTLDGTLEVAKLDETDQAQVYQIRQVNPADYKQLRQSFQIMQPASKQSLDVVGGQTEISAQVCVYERNMRANQRWIFQPPLDQNSNQQTKYSIINLLSGLRLWKGKKNSVIQDDNREKVWQIRDKIGTNGSLYNSQERKYLSRLSDGQLALTNDKLTHWSIISGTVGQLY